MIPTKKLITTTLASTTILTLGFTGAAEANHGFRESFHGHHPHHNDLLLAKFKKFQKVHHGHDKFHHDHGKFKKVKKVKKVRRGKLHHKKHFFGHKKFYR